MAEYIERETLKTAMIKYGFLAPDMTVTEFIEDELPVADVAPAQCGRWERDRGLIKCSACGFGMYPNYPRFMDGACVGTGYSEPNYCPNCGAKMSRLVDVNHFNINCKIKICSFEDASKLKPDMVSESALMICGIPKSWKGWGAWKDVDYFNVSAAYYSCHDDYAIPAEFVVDVISDVPADL